MKRNLQILIIATIAITGLASCSSIRHTAAVEPVQTVVASTSTADLNVSSQKISYTLRPSKAVRRCGEKAVIETAVAEALKSADNADVMVGMQYEIKKTRNFFGKVKIKYVTVTGYPATYYNFRPTDK